MAGRERARLGREGGGERPSGQPRPAARGMRLGAGRGYAGMQPVARRGYPGMRPAAVQGCIPVLGGDARACSPGRTGQRPLPPSRRSRSAAGAGSRPPAHRGLGAGAARPLQLSPCFCPRARGSAARDVWCYVNTCERRWGLGYGRIFLLNGQKAGGCGWMFRRVPVTGLTGQIFGCFLDYNDWTSAGEGVGAHVHSPSVYVGFATMPSGFPASCGAAGCSGLLRRGRAGCASRFSRREMLRAAAAAAAGAALPLPAPGGFALAARVCLNRLHPTGERLELNLSPCHGSVPAQPQMDWAAVLLLTNQEGRTWLIQSRSLPDEDLVTASHVGSSVCGSCWFYLLVRVGTCARVLFLEVRSVICL